MVKESLRDWHIVIMRPSHQAQPLIEAVTTQGGAPLLLPLMEIQPLKLDEKQFANAIFAAKECSHLVVTSANAVFCAPREVLDVLQKRGIPIITMGKATTKALEEKGLQVFFTAPKGSTSESLLQESFLGEEAMSKQNILLLAGEGGRTVLADTLQERGAKVTWLKTYQQVNVRIDIAKTLKSWQRDKRCCFIATSSHALESLWRLTPSEDVSWLQDCPLIVVSERIALRARELGSQHVLVAKAPYVDDLIVALQEMVQLYTL